MRNHINIKNIKNNDPEFIFYSVKGLGEILGIGKNAAYRLIHSAGFPAVKIGGEYKISEAALKRWLANKERRG